MSRHIIAVHGGAGTILRSDLSPTERELYLEALEHALSLGDLILSQGGTALDAVDAATESLEDNPLFNAGRGSVFTHEGTIEMDASIMDGNSLKAGAVACVKNVKNPVKLARAIMEKSAHVFLSGNGAADFARDMNLMFEEDSYFYTDKRYAQLLQAREAGSIDLDHTERKFGTCGAVAMDVYGNLAAATSTGGMTNKRFGRIGDTPVIGAGVYANNKTCAVSCTGHGEYFLRGIVAYDVSCLMEYGGLSLAQACQRVIFDKLLPISGEGGLIAVDHKGNAEMVFNSEGMYRGIKKQGETFVTGIYRD